MGKIPIFEKNYGLTLLQKFEFCHFFFKKKNYVKEYLLFYLEYQRTPFLGLFCPKQTMEKILIFDQNHEPLCKNSNFATFLKINFYVKESLLFYLEYQQTIFLGLFCPKTNYGKNTNFGLKPWTNPFAKIRIFTLF